MNVGFMVLLLSPPETGLLRQLPALATAIPGRVAYLSDAPLRSLASLSATYEIKRLCTSSRVNMCCDLYICFDNDMLNSYLNSSC